MAAHRRTGALVAHRRELLLALGAGAIATGVVGSAIAASRGSNGAPVLTDRDAHRALGEAADLGASGLAGSPEEAARAAAEATPTLDTPLSRDPVAHLLRRATFGPTPRAVEQVRGQGINGWLERQLDPGSIDDPIAEAAVAQLPTVGMTTAQLRAAIPADDWRAMYELGRATLARQFWSERQLYEVMVDFWSNLLHVTCPFGGGWDTRTTYDRDVIRAHALGRFRDLLLASARGTAMLRYLNNNRSHRRAVNENYGRELLELHTVGIDGGYTESDVRNSAYLMTGRTVTREGEFRYEADRHWVGEVRVLDFRHDNPTPEGGLEIGDEYLSYLAGHPATARRIARKLVVRFVTDNPPTPLVDRLAESYLDNDTAILPVLRTLFSSLELWIATGRKTRRPLENLAATVRALGITPGGDTTTALEKLYWLSNQLGQAPLAWRPPDGYPDVASAWAGAHGTLAVWNSHRALVQGWHDGLTYPSPQTLVADPPATAGAYLDALTTRLLFGPMAGQHRRALLEFLDVAEDRPIPDGMLPHLVPLLLDSAYHTLR